MNQERVQNLIAYILMRAAEEEGGNRALRPIHLLKYMYLADLAYAARHDGETYTGIPWRFHHFGPWDEDAWQEIEPATQAIGATQRIVPSDRYNDTIEYFAPEHVQQRHLVRLEGTLPAPVMGSVDRAVREHRNDTKSLLQAVYLTKPMRFTTPREPINFAHAVEDAPESTANVWQAEGPLSTKQRKRRAEHIQTAHEKIQAKLAEKRAKRSNAKPAWQPPRYDEVFLQGVEWLDSDAGDPITPTTEAAEVEFDDSVWTSEMRRVGELP